MRLIYTITILLSSHSADLYNPADELRVAEYVRYPVGTFSAESFIDATEINPAEDQRWHFDDLTSLLPALNDGRHGILGFIVDQAAYELPEPVLSAPVTAVDFSALSLAVNYPATGGTDITTRTRFNLYGVPEPSTLWLGSIGLLVVVAINRLPLARRIVREPAIDPDGSTEGVIGLGIVFLSFAFGVAVGFLLQ